MCALLDIAPLDLDLTLGCGQVFRWQRGDDGVWSGPLGSQFVSLSPRQGGVEVHAVPGGGDTPRAVGIYLRAGDDAEAIQQHLLGDPVLGRGISRLKGLRIVKMDEWECLASYVLATYANIPRITSMIDTLAKSYGKRIVDKTHSFPSLRELEGASSDDLRRLGLGYRADHLHELCQRLDQHAIGKMTQLDYESLRKRLLDLPGVGDKVADCVCLFGFGRLEAFPIDVWVKRALRRLFGMEGSYKDLREFASKRFGKYAGYAQEYLFFNERSYASKGTCVFDQGTC